MCMYVYVYVYVNVCNLGTTCKINTKNEPKTTCPCRPKVNKFTSEFIAATCQKFKCIHAQANTTTPEKEMGHPLRSPAARLFPSTNYGTLADGIANKKHDVWVSTRRVRVNGERMTHSTP